MPTLHSSRRARTTSVGESSMNRIRVTDMQSPRSPPRNLPRTRAALCDDETRPGPWHPAIATSDDCELRHAGRTSAAAGFGFPRLTIHDPRLTRNAAGLTFPAQAAIFAAMAANPRGVARRRVETAPEPYYSVETYSAEDSVGYLIAGARTRIFRALDIELAKLGFTSAQWPILRTVADGGTPIAAELCRRLNYDTGSMTRMLNRLEAKGVIVRETDSEDRRVIRLRMTPRGKRLYPRLCAAAVRVLNRLVQGFTADEIHAMNGQLRRMLDNMSYLDEEVPR